MRSFACCLISCIAGTSIAHAAPSESKDAIDFLINAPMTMLDKGVIEIERSLDQVNSSVYFKSRRPAVISSFGFISHVSVELDHILINSFIYPDQMDEVARKDACEKMVLTIEDVLGFQPKDGNMQYLSESLQKIFSHVGYDTVKYPKNIGYRLAATFEIQANVVANSGKTYCHSVGGQAVTPSKPKL